MPQVAIATEEVVDWSKTERATLEQLRIREPIIGWAIHELWLQIADLQDEAAAAQEAHQAHVEALAERLGEITITKLAALSPSDKRELREGIDSYRLPRFTASRLYGTLEELIRIAQEIPGYEDAYLRRLALDYVARKSASGIPDPALAEGSY